MAIGRVPGWVWGALIVSHLLVLGWSLKLGSWEFPDTDRYLQAAENLGLHGQLYARTWPAAAPQGQAVQEFTIRPLGYPVVVLSLGGRPPVLLLIVQNMLSLLNIGLVLAFWARWARPKKSYWMLALAGVLSFPAQLIYASAVMSEVLLQTAIMIVASAGLLFIKKPQRRYISVVMGAIVVGLLLKPVFYPMAAIAAGLGIWLAWRKHRFEFAVSSFIPVLVVCLYMGWNKERTGYFHFSSITEINLLHYNAAGVVRQLDGPEAEEQWVAGVLREANAQPDFTTRQQVIQQRAGAILRAHPWVYARQHLKGMAALFLDPGRFDFSQFLRLDMASGKGLLAQARAGGLLRALGQLPLGMLSVLGLILLANVARLGLAIRGFLLLKNAEPMLRYGRWLAVGLLLYVALLTGPLGAARFLVPVWPLLYALALVGLSGARKPVLSGTYEAAPVGENQGQN